MNPMRYRPVVYGVRSTPWLTQMTRFIGIGACIAATSLCAQTSNPAPPQDKLTSTSESVPGLPEGSTNGKGLWNRKHLLGDWGSERSALAEKGLKFDIYYVADSLTNPYGGPEDPAVWGRIRATADVDFSKFTNWQGLTFHINGLWQYGTDLSSQYTHTLVDSSSLPSSHTLRLGTFFLQQDLLQHRLAIRLGQMAAQDTYGNSEYGASSINQVLGYSQSNLTQAVVFAFDPASVPAFELKITPRKHAYVKAMVQSQERNPYKTDPTGVAFHFGGPVLATELGYFRDPESGTAADNPDSTKRKGNHTGLYRFGAGYNPHLFMDPLSQRSSPGNYLLYGQVTQAVYRRDAPDSGSNRGLDLIYGEDWSPADVAQNSQQIMAGARWNGIFGGRHGKDTASIGYVWTSVGSHYRQAQILAGRPALTFESLFETNYMANLTPWVLLQPVAQWFVRPGGDVTRGLVFVLGFRTKVTF